jgi:hypothetical protein
MTLLILIVGTSMTAGMISRRAVVSGAFAASSALVMAGFTSRRAAAGASRIYLSARRDGEGGYRATGIWAGGAIAFDIPMPARGHSMAMHPKGQAAVFFGRRPGTFARVVNPSEGRAMRLIDAAPGRSFNGHGVFTPDGARLFASETVGDTGDGMIGIYDPADGYRRIGEMPSGGLDPHDIRFLSDGRTLVVPNGGILQLAEMPRVKLNIPTMTPSLDYIDSRNAASLAKITLPKELHQLSIRHLSVGFDDRVAVAMQYEGPFVDRVPLVGMHRRGDAAMQLIGPPGKAGRRLRQYCGSASIDPSGSILGITSPRGGVVVFWDVTTDRFLGVHGLPDCCGIAPGDGPGRFLISNGHGVLQRFDARRMQATAADAAPLAGAQWDNHMLAVERLA